MWPAALPDERVLGVASVYSTSTAAPHQNSLQPSDWSNRGGWVDFSALGEGVVSTFVDGPETPSRSADDPYDDNPDEFFGPDAYALWTGTSFATAKITGVLADAMVNDARPVLDVIASVRSLGRPIADFGDALPV